MCCKFVFNSASFVIRLAIQLSTLPLGVLSVSRAEPSPRLKEAGAAEALLIEDGARVVGFSSVSGVDLPQAPYSGYFPEGG